MLREFTIYAQQGTRRYPITAMAKTKKAAREKPFDFANQLGKHIPVYALTWTSQRPWQPEDEMYETWEIGPSSD